MRVENAVLCFSTIYMTGEGRIRLLYETHRPNDRPYSILQQPEDLLNPQGVLKASEDACYMLLASVGSANYGHWLVDDLARLKAFRVLREMYPNKLITLLVPEAGSVMDGIRAESINYVLSGESNFATEFFDPKAVITLPELFYVTPISYHPMIKSPGAMDWLSSVSRNLQNGSLSEGTPGQKIFVARRVDHGRTLVNAVEIESRLNELGFVYHRPRGAVIPRASAGVCERKRHRGLYGSRDDKHAVCASRVDHRHACARGLDRAFLWDLAASRGHSYAVCYGAPTQADVAPNNSSYEVNADTLAAMLSRLRC